MGARGRARAAARSPERQDSSRNRAPTTIPMMTMMGWASAVMVAITMLAAVTLLPALLGVAGKRVNSLRVPFIKQ